jgi:large conductance mechanosensitive channel
MLNEFKKFIMRGNVLDLAVGIIIGAAFNGIVNSLVTDIIMPPIGLAMGGLDFADFFFVLKPVGAHFPTVAAAKAAGAVTMNYGLFINHIINFVIEAAAVFFLVKQMNRIRLSSKDKAPPAPTPTEALLTEIRDLLKK